MPRSRGTHVSRHFDNALVKLITGSAGKAVGGRFIHLLDHYATEKGLEWTASRVKTLWNVALLLRAGMVDDIATVLEEARINKLGPNGIPKGIEGAVVMIWSKSISPHTLRRWSVVLRSYTSIALPKLSVKQMRKAKASINQPGHQPRLSPIAKSDRSAKISCSAEDVVGFLPYTPNVKAWRDRYLKRSSVSDLSGVSSYPSLIPLKRRDRDELPYLSMVASLTTKGRIPPVLTRLLGDVPLRRAAEEVQYQMGDETYGNICCIQEGGAKARVICSPNAWVQLYMKPMHNYLMRYISHLECSQGKEDWRDKPVHYVGGTSCVLDQVRGVYLAIRKMSQGSFIAGVDLSSATDRFPLSYQQTILKELGIPEYAAALDELKGPYLGLDGEEWSYNQGQPMGLFGSFPLFHISHYSLLNGISLKLGLPGNGENFAVIGDDVIIFDAKLLAAYRAILQAWGVSTSDHKSYTGNLVEFAGFVVTKTRKGKVTAFRPYKHGRRGVFSSVLNVLHGVGYPVSKWGRFWDQAYTLYRSTRGARSLDLSPLLSDADRPIGLEAKLTEQYTASLVQRLSRSSKSGTLPFGDWLSSDWKASLKLLFSQTEHDSGRIMAGRQDFNPAYYISQETQRRNNFRNFFKDPLIRNELNQASPQVVESSQV